MEIKPVEELTFEEALEELEKLTDRLARGEISLRESVEGYKRGTRLLQRCRAELNDARQTIEMLEKENVVTKASAGDDFDEIGF